MNQTTKRKIWTETFRVRSYEPGPSGTISFATITGYLQETAANHARHLGFSIYDLAPQQLTWVLLRLRISLTTFPRWQDTVHIETWPAALDSRFAYRDWLLFDQNRQLVGKATSTWIMIHLKTRRPVPPPQRILHFHPPDRPRVFTDNQWPRIKPPQAAKPLGEQPIRVLRSDIDMNQHVNSTRYVDWALDALPDSIVLQQPATLYIEFRAESHQGDNLLSCVYPHPQHSNAYLHALTSESSQRTLAIGQTLWGN